LPGQSSLRVALKPLVEPSGALSQSGALAERQPSSSWRGFSNRPPPGLGRPEGGGRAAASSMRSSKARKGPGGVGTARATDSNQRCPLPVVLLQRSTIGRLAEPNTRNSVPRRCCNGGKIQQRARRAAMIGARSPRPENPARKLHGTSAYPQEAGANAALP